MSLSVKDRFAAAAMQTILARHQVGDEEVKSVARWAYNVAEAMCAERARRSAAQPDKGGK